MVEMMVVSMDFHLAEYLVCLKDFHLADMKDSTMALN